MSTYTKHYKLIKPSYDEDIDVKDINNNMDVIDNTINGLNFVQNAYKDNNGLHLNKRDGSVIDIPLNYLPLTGGNVTGNITVQNNQVLYATNTITDNSGNYYTEYSDGSIVCGGIFTDLNQSGSESGDGHAIETYARRVNYLKPITKTMISMNAMLVPDGASVFWGNSSACVMLRKYDTTGFYVEIRSNYTSMLKNTSKCMWRAYFK